MELIRSDMNPLFNIRANNNDITKVIMERFISLSLTDETGYESDVLEIVLANDDPKNRIKIPPKGAEIELDLGYEDFIRPMGMFVFDEVRIDAWPCRVTLICRAAVFNKTKAGKENMTNQVSRSWEKGTTILGMANKIASDHNMTAKVAKEIGDIELPHFDQSDESDLNLLLRVGQKYDAVVKVAGGFITITKRGSKKSATGKDLPVMNIREEDLTAYSWRSSTRETAGTVITFYRITKKAARQEVQVGEGEPVRRIKTLYPSKEMALSVAKSALAKASRDELELSLSCIGDPRLMAEMLATVTGIYDVIDGDYIIKSVRHNVGDAGYSCDLTLVKPNSEEEPPVKVVAHQAPKKKSSDFPGDDYNAGVITLPPLKK